MVAPVDACEFGGESDAKERVDFDAVGLHSLEEVVAKGVEGADVVVDDADFDAGTGALDEDVAELVAQLIVGDDVELDVDVGLGGAEVGEESGEVGGAVGEDFEGVVGVECCAVEGVEEADALTVFGRDTAGEFREGLLGADGAEFAAFAARDDADVAERTSEEEVEDGAADGKQQERSDPSERLEGVAVFAEHDGNECENQADVAGGEKPHDAVP